MNKMDIFIVIDAEVTSENTGKKNTRVARENVSFLEQLAEVSHIAVHIQHNEVFHKINSKNKFMFSTGDTVAEFLQDMRDLSNFYRAERTVVLMSLKMLKMVFQTDCSFVENIYMYVDNEFVRTHGIPEFLDPSRMLIQNKISSGTMTRYEIRIGETFETQYMLILKNLVKSKTLRNCRNGVTKSTFGGFMRFDLRDGFPLLTTRKMFFRGIVEELLFFIRGDTDTKCLENIGVNIWRGNTNREFLDNVGLTYKEGMMGPLYGAQWRHFNGVYDETTGKSSGGVDQLVNVINLIQTDPNSRRIIMTSFNPSQADDAVLYPCHSVVLQFYVDNDSLDLMAYSRSIDWFHGAPFNIASYSLLLTLVASLTGHIPRIVNVVFGDSHIYRAHEDECRELLNRPIFKPPRLNIKKNLLTIEDIEGLKFEDFYLENYQCHNNIKADMVS